MHWRPAYLWLLGPLLFGPSVLIWAASIWMVGFGEGCSMRGVYLPLFAAILGFSAPILALRASWNARLKSTLLAMACYWLTMLSWGFLDVMHRQYQLGVHYHGATPPGHISLGGSSLITGWSSDRSLAAAVAAQFPSKRPPG